MGFCLSRVFVVYSLLEGLNKVHNWKIAITVLWISYMVTKYWDDEMYGVKCGVLKIIFYLHSVFVTKAGNELWVIIKMAGESFASVACEFGWFDICALYGDREYCQRRLGSKRKRTSCVWSDKLAEAMVSSCARSTWDILVILQVVPLLSFLSSRCFWVLLIMVVKT